MRRRTRIAMAMRRILRLGKQTNIGVLLTEESDMETVTLIMPLDASICALMALTAAVEWKWSIAISEKHKETLPSTEGSNKFATTS